MLQPRSRGYFGIGIEGVSKSANIGALLRTAHAFGAAFCFSVGTGWDARAARHADTADTPSHVPLWRFPDLASLSLPQGCVLVAVELLDTATDLPSFRHPLNAAYVLGPERAGVSPALLARCQHVVRIPTRFALNLAVAGALVLYDRLLQHGRFAERPVGSAAGGSHASGDAAAAGPAPASSPVSAAVSAAVSAPGGIGLGHGPPRFRRTIPAWMAPVTGKDGIES
ncbi:MAG TPA: RNA methyltransferase [Acetobacteraceae bacterium]